MAQPANYNISYYRGDTYTFEVYPKAANGDPLTLVDGNDDPILAYFYISTNRDDETPTDAFEAIASLDTVNSKIVCQISPSIGRTLVPGTTYVFEIKIQNQETNEVYTLVTGSITVTGAVQLLEAV